MDNQSKPSLLARQILRVNRRLFFQAFLVRLIWCWSGALVLATAWLLVQPFVLPNAGAVHNGWVIGGLLGGGTVAALSAAFRAAPSRVESALSLDAKFGLQERVTTSLLLSAEQQVSPVGKALLDDVHQRVGKLDIAGKFPVVDVLRSWSTALVPGAAALLALVALFYEPPLSPAKGDGQDELQQPPANQAEIAQKFNQLKKKPVRPHGEVRSEDLEKIEAELKEIANRPRETREQLRERIREMQQVEDEIKDRQKQLMDKSKSLQQQLRQLDQQSQKNKEGPANDLEKALAAGDLAKAQDELDKLAEKMRNNELTEKEKDRLKQQLDQLQDKLDRLAKNKDKEDELQKLFRDGKIDADTLQRELEKLQQDSEKLKDLADLAEQLGQCKKCLEQGDSAGAMESLKGAAGKLKNLDLNDKDLQDLENQLQRLREAKEAASKGDRPGNGQDGKNEGEGNDGPGGKGDGKGDTDQPNQGGIGAGKRPLGKDSGQYNSFDARQRTDFNPKGQKIFDGFAPGQNFKSKPGPDIAGEVKQAAQEAPEAIEQQRIPKAARDLAKGYFKNIGGQDDKAPAKPSEKK